MDQVYQTLGVEPGGMLYVRELQVVNWGRTLRLVCVYRLSPTDEYPLDITFLDCRDMKWRVYAFDDGRSEVLVVDARLGRGGHRSPAHILTDRFGLTLTYGEISVDADEGAL